MTDTTPTTTQNIDLRPAAGTIKGELLRLGLKFDHAHDPAPDGETWRNYDTNLTATFTTPDTTTVTLTDATSNTSRDTTIDELKTATKILTVLPANQ